MAEAGNLFAALGLRINFGSFAAGDKALRGTKKAADELDGAWQDRQGRWRAASGRMLSMAEKTKLVGKGIKGVGDEAEKAGKKSASAFDGVNTALRVMGTYLAGRAAFGALIKFNSTVEDSRNKIAGMLALTKKTDLKDQLATADSLMANLQRRAATLPGTTAEYVAMLSNITQPVSDAGLSMKQLEDMTVSAVVAAKALGVESEVAARDIDQAIRGQFHAIDQLTGKILGTMGFKGEEGRSRFNAMSQKKRAETLFQALNQKQIAQLAEAQGKTFSGVLSTLQDALEQFFGKVGKPLFEGLTAAIKDVNRWLDENASTVIEVASAIGGALVTAFEVLRSTIVGVTTVIGFLISNSELMQSVLIALGLLAIKSAVLWTLASVKMAAAWVMALGPITLIIIAIAAIAFGIRMLIKHWDAVKSAIGSVLTWVGNKVRAIGDLVRRVGTVIRDFFTEDIPNAIKAAWEAAFNFIANLPVVKQLRELREGLADPGGAVGRTIKGLGSAINRDAIVAPAPAKAGGPVSVNINGGINVTSTKVDGEGVAMDVNRAISEKLAGMLRHTMDTVA